VPYCKRCNLHVYLAGQVRTITALAAGLPAAFGVWAGLLGSKGAAISLFCIAIPLGIVGFVLSRRRAKRGLSSACTALASAVQLEGWYGHAQSFRFSNQAYAEEFLRRNNRKSHSGLLPA